MSRTAPPDTPIQPLNRRLELRETRHLKMQALARPPGCLSLRVASRPPRRAAADALTCRANNKGEWWLMCVLRSVRDSVAWL